MLIDGSRSGGSSQPGSPHPVAVVDSEIADFDITDPQGNIILQCRDGHIRTKLFSSRSIVDEVQSLKTLVAQVQTLKAEVEQLQREQIKVGASMLADLDFIDPEQNILLRLRNGHVYTKNFNSEDVLQRLANLEQDGETTND